TAGTILGAALASVVGAVAGTVYTAGLDRTSRRLTTVMRRGWQRVQGEDPSAELEPGEGLDLVVEHHDPGTMAPVPTGRVVTARELARTRRAVGKRVLVGAVAIFTLTLVAITGFELATGYSLTGGSGGTTVTDAVRPQPSPSAEPTPSEEPTPTPTPTPTETPTATPSPTPTPTPTPSETPAEPTPSPTPTQEAAATAPAQGAATPAAEG
ncbi:MAG: hypothetical protein AAGC63_06930, partial [Propionicimonas sp.]|nr:hypothetical protein [Propionicimonas sp.]